MRARGPAGSRACTGSFAAAAALLGLSEDAVDLLAGGVDDVDDALLLFGCRGLAGLGDRPEQLADRGAQIELARVGAFSDLLPRWGLDVGGDGTAFLGQLEKSLLAVGFATADQALIHQHLQGRVDRARAGAPQLLAAFGDLLDDLVAVHR